MIEFLPYDMQERVAEHIREYIATLEDEKRWDVSFKRTQANLVASAQKARQEISEGLSTSMESWWISESP